MTAHSERVSGESAVFHPILEDEEHLLAPIPMELEIVSTTPPVPEAQSSQAIHTNNNNIVRTTRIQFSADDEVVTIEPYYEFSDEEHNALWYTDVETCLFEAESNKTIKAYKKSVFGIDVLDATRYCLRGLEDRLSTRDYMMRRGLQMEYTRGILLEQERQRKLGLREPFGMHEHMGISSKWATARAIELANADAQDAASSEAMNHVSQKLMRPNDRISSTANARRMDSRQLIRRQAHHHQQRQQQQHPHWGQRNAQWAHSLSSRASASMPSLSRSSAPDSGSTTNATWGDPTAVGKPKSARDSFALMA